ncbi:MAG TPA: PHB depolymerase family esterase [Chitinispirillaceae bacterium]|jgi:poly(3-hydroxybutyrate) depolymerase|nr:PHB depolymerase family esterase [Chitinispirillaceae bacterium]
MNRAIVLTASILFLAANLFGQTGSFVSGGQTRTFYAHVPSGLQNPPLVISMHGMGGNGSQQRQMSRFDQLANKENFVVVYPDGLNSQWDIMGSTDVNFLLALIDTMHARYGIDLNRVYATGFSMGGMMSYKLACSAADKIAAIGPVAGYPLGGMMGRSCSPARPVPIIHIHGSKDSVVFFSGLASYINQWVEKNGCPGTAQITQPYPESKPSSKVKKEYYGVCNQGSEIIVLTVEGMEHAYPGSFGSSDINASEEVWAFFKAHSHGSIDVGYFSTGKRHSRCVSAFYKAGKIHLQSTQEIRSIRVMDLGGKIISTFKAGKEPVRAVTFPFNRTARGVYLIDVFDITGHSVLNITVH